MGGSAFNLETHGFTTSRMTKEQYDTVAEFIIPLLKEYFTTVRIPPEAPEKLTFGDLDIMVMGPTKQHAYLPSVAPFVEMLGNWKLLKGVIYSTPTSNIAVTFPKEDIFVQVDVHVVERPELWEIEYWMHSYGDTGMIVSSMLKAWDLRLSSVRGLWVEIAEHGPFVLSLRMSQIANFLGLDWERHQKGFDTVDELFDWIQTLTIKGERIGIKSKGKLDRKKKADRPMWVEFWSRGDLETAYEPSGEEKDSVISAAVEDFDKGKEWRQMYEAIERNKIVKEKFNGKKVEEWTGFSGKALGTLMKELRADERLTPQKVYELDEDEIKDIVMRSCKRSVEVRPR